MSSVAGLVPSPSAAFPGLLPPPSPFPFDPNDPMTAMMAMQAMGALGFPPLPVMPSVLPPFPQPTSPTGFGQPTLPNASLAANGPQPGKSRERCRDYDEKGFCALGGTCPYDHGGDHIVVPEQGEGRDIVAVVGHETDYGIVEYDPTNSSILGEVQKTPSGVFNGQASQQKESSGDQGRGRGRGRGGAGGYTSSRRGRAEFSHLGPNQDRSITTVFVENIPEEKFSEEAVREFFSAFGAIQEVQLQAYKRLALVKYDTWASAKRAYESPKVIFDNRFVKVYWYKPDSMQGSRLGANGAAKAGSPTSTKSGGEPQGNLEEIRKKQEELQKAHEEKMKKIKETEASRRELEKRKEELLKSQEEERRKLLERIAAKTGNNGVTASSEQGTPAPDGKPNGHAVAGTGAEKKASSQTEALRAHLAALQAEARRMGIDSSLSDDPYASSGRGRGRGSYRGRGGYIPRGRGYDTTRGGYRGRGAIPYAWTGRGGGANKLDNRPKKVAVSGVEFDDQKDEALRQYLLVGRLFFFV